ncbi:MAG: aminodeoxychorismate/anthranilate synthase component II [Flavobacteriales bacterium]|nr:aminodeoxychorismate/anthranilate synthase component II [Flavobacteriales bacterium]MCX7650547.1 aminodeoxychorismate/anthranilate synthase component II [Flavobacteriales bacterium]MDW8431755.1 aminodeoxychorismate/anthranilate synthase component II [Flavobacteriales bacterium]
MEGEVRKKGTVWVIDNYDSFTYNLVHYVHICCPDDEIAVWRNDDKRLAGLTSLPCSRLVISPGPGLPEEAGHLMDVLRLILNAEKPPVTLGVCLGMQALALANGGSLFNLERVYHGEASRIRTVAEDPLFRGLPKTFNVGRYHSWAVGDTGPDFFVTARSSDGVAMAMRHKNKPVFAVQFHPESILTPRGLDILRNWSRI